MGKFNLMDLMQTTQEPSGTEDSFPIEYIHIDDIIPSQNNFYSVEEIDELASAILLVGLEHNLSVERDEQGQNILISGHRRRLALKKLVSEGHTQFELAPCRVTKKKTDAFSNLRLLLANSTARVLSDYEKITQAKEIKEQLLKLKNEGYKIEGRLRNIVADIMNVSPTKVGQMETINKNLPEDMKEDFKSGKINFSTALKASQKSTTEKADVKKPVEPMAKEPTEQVTQPQPEQVEEPSQLLPCPFCGCDDVSVIKIGTLNGMAGGTPIYAVICEDCGARGSRENTQELAAIMWNTRV